LTTNEAVGGRKSHLKKKNKHGYKQQQAEIGKLNREQQKRHRRETQTIYRRY